MAEAPQAGPGTQYRVLEPAVAPTDSSGPARKRLLLMSLVLCLGLAAVAVFIAEQFDTSFHNIDELRMFTQVPVLVSVPRIITQGDIWRRRMRFGTAAAFSLRPRPYCIAVERLAFPRVRRGAARLDAVAAPELPESAGDAARGFIPGEARNLT